MHSLFKLLLALVFAGSMAACTTIESTVGVPRVYQATIADTITTGIALEQGGRELNPLGFLGATAGKLVYLYIRSDLTEEERSRYDRLTTSLWTAAAANNVVVILAPGSGVFLGLGVGAYVGWSIWQGW
jgi:hypothetical protein